MTLRALANRAARGENERRDQTHERHTSYQAFVCLISPFVRKRRPQAGVWRVLHARLSLSPVLRSPV
jgi:hypothetical protein